MLKGTPETYSVRRNLYQARLMFWLFIASLAMFFMACIAVYLLLIYGLKNPPDTMTIEVAYAPLRMPLTFIPSTLLLLGTSVTLHMASRRIANERREPFLKLIRISLVLSVLFIAVQILAMETLLEQHFELSKALYPGHNPSFGVNRMNGMCFTFAVIHALHVLGGIGYIIYIDYFGQRGYYDHERHWAVDHCAWYWHFLDIVWLTMIATFWLTQ